MGRRERAKRIGRKLRLVSWRRVLRLAKRMRRLRQRNVPLSMVIVLMGDLCAGAVFIRRMGMRIFWKAIGLMRRMGKCCLNCETAFSKRLCEDASANPNRNYYLLVDEINRGDIPRIFGELLTLLESNKRGKTVVLPLSKTSFAVPTNVYVIGTMNTADRSIALLDAALRRRFGFIELMPDSSTLARTLIEGIPLAAWLDALNARICEHVGRDARNLQIGHSYFLENGRPIRDFAHLSRVLREDIVPLLEEYCYEDYAALEKILGSSLVDGQKQQVRDELFEPARQDELITALLAPCPEITATSQAVMLEAEAQNEAQELDNDAEDDTEATDNSE